ncbi:phosphatase inhibitor-domain-containing protein [Globomyces pollinis-pini]|nr:phosphatase inhibitor-domain-containing protein [Globomyces pollinis-pini]
MQRERIAPTTTTSTATSTEQQTSTSQVQGTILLHSDSATSQRVVHFEEGIIDNEHLDRKKSKICCIFRKPYNPNDSSSDESSSDDESKGNSYEVQPKQRKSKAKHSHSSHCSH